MKTTSSLHALLCAAVFLSISAGCSTFGLSGKGERSIAVQSYTSTDSGLMANSELITSGDEAVLVDAQFTRTEARKVIDMIKSSGKKLTTIFITSPHPDHYLGLELISREFPKAMILSTPEVIEDIRKTAKERIAYWKGIYRDDLADNYIVPVPVDSNELFVGNEKIVIVKFPEGQAPHGAALYIPSLEALIAGDLVYNQVHLWLADNYPLGWLRNLKEIRDVGIIDTIYPGHGPAGDLRLLEVNEQYIQSFLIATHSPATRKQAEVDMKERYPDWALPIVVDLSVSARIK